MWYSTFRCLVTLCLSLLVVPFATGAQPLVQMPRIGVLVLETSPHQGFDALRHGLRELGYVEGQTIAFESRRAEFNFERLPALAAELVRLPVDVLVTHGPQGIRAAKDATSTIPIVMTRMDDTEEHGFVASLARPRRDRDRAFPPDWRVKRQVARVSSGGAAPPRARSRSVGCDGYRQSTPYARRLSEN
jgi:ABC-type uncharacterized transport system substrate-binding protein